MNYKEVQKAESVELTKEVEWSAPAVKGVVKVPKPDWAEAVQPRGELGPKPPKNVRSDIHH